MLISRFHAPPFTPVYRRWNFALGVPSSATIRDAWRRRDGETSLRMSFQNLEIGPDVSPRGHFRIPRGPG